MKASKTLPPHYTLYRSLDLSRKKMVLAMNAAGIVLLFIFGWLFMGIAAALNPQFFTLQLAVFARTVSVGAFILVMLTVIALHELIHALCFWIFTRERPKLGFNLLYAYAAAPDWYFPRYQFIIIGLAPLVLLTLLGLLLMPFAGFSATPPLILALTVNAAGAIGDLIITGWLLNQPTNTLIRDEGAVVNLYQVRE